MKKSVIKLLTIISIISLLICFACLSSSAVNYGQIEINGEKFDGTFEEALFYADAGSEIGIYGSVETTPCGHSSTTSKIDGITIKGMDEDAYIHLPTNYIPINNGGIELLTICGKNVTIQDITVDASCMLDGALGISYDASNITLDNVKVANGKKAALMIRSAKDITLKNVTARNGLVSDIFILGTGDASGIKFDNCFAMNNLNACNLLISNEEGAVTNVDASGVLCASGVFGVKDVKIGDTRYPVSYSKAAKKYAANGYGEDKQISTLTIDTSWGMYYDVEQVLFGCHTHERGTAVATMTTSRYGFNSIIFFDDEDVANELSLGEKVQKIEDADTGFFAQVKRFFAKVLQFFISIFKNTNRV